MAELLIPIKVYIENLLSLIGDLLSKLSNLKVGSAGFKSLLNLINSMKNELDKLLIQGSKPFVDANLFVKAERSIDKLEDLLQKAEMTLGRLKFSDLELSPNLKADLQAFEDLINSIKTNLKSVKDTAKLDFLGSSLGQIWQSQFDSTAITKSFSLITNNIRAEVNKLIAIVASAEQAMNDYLNAIKGNNSIDNFLKNKNPLDESSLGVERYALIFLETARGLRFRSGGKTILEEWLKSLLLLDDATIKSLVEGSASKVKAELENRLKAILISNKDIINNNAGSITNYDTLKAKLEQLNSIMQQLGASELMVNTVELALRALLTDTSRAMDDYKDNAVNAARGNTEFLSTSNLMRTQLESLRSTLELSNAQFILLLRTQLTFNLMKTAVVNFMGFNQVLNLTKNAVKNAINHIKELDSVMNKISIVTDMSTGDLWNLVDAYSKMALSYGVSIKGAYEVSQIYYQLGLQTADVLTLTNETLKLAKISGLDYATTTDYMTTALRGFKMEMTDASTVVDVYSNLAAHTAVSLEELAVAMSKTASSMESVGATFEEASAMIGTMVAVTRESATNIGSAMKSIASRYGELTKDPTKLVDSEGEAMAFNKVDTALLSVGISMKTVDGQFREFTDVIIELGEKWDLLDSTQLRYIATQFAGNRQQSRFLALVSNVDLLKSNLDVAMNSEDIGTLLALKALDSIEAKTELVRVAYLLFYTTIGAENVWKGFLDGAKNVINTLNSFPKLFGKLPIAAIAAVASIVNVIKTVGIKAITGFAETFGNSLFKGFASAQGSAALGAEGIFDSFINTLKSKIGIAETTGQEIGKAVTKGMNTATGLQLMSPDKLKGIDKDTYDKNLLTITSFLKNVSGFAVTDPEDLNNSYLNLAFNMQRTGLLSSYVWQDIQSHPENALLILELYIKKLLDTNLKLLETGNVASVSGNKLKNIFNNAKFGKGLESFGSALNMISMMIDTSQPGMKTLSGSIMSIGGAASLAGIGILAMNGALKSIPWMAIASGVFAIINGLSTLFITPEEKLEELTTKAEELSNKAKESKAEYRTLDNSIKKLDELKEKRYESAEAAEEYLTAVDDLAEKFPEMISGFDDAGNIIITTTSAENVLTEARKKAALAAADAAKAEYAKAKEEQNEKKKELINGWLLGNASADLEHYTWIASGAMYDPSSIPLEVRDALVELYPFIAHNAEGAEQDITSKEGQDQLKALGEILYKSGIENEFNDTSVLDRLRESYSAMIQANSDYQELANISEAYAKLIVSSWMLSQDANNHVLTFLYNSTGALAMVTDAITNALVHGNEKIGSAGGFEVNDENARIMDSRGNYSKAMNNFISSLSQERLELFNKMYDASNIYSAEDFKTEFKGELNWDDTVYDIITGYYNKSLTAIIERLQNSLKLERTFVDKNGVEYLKSTNDFYTQYADAILTATSLIQELLLNEILSLYHNLASEGFVSLAIESGKQALNVFSEIKKIEGIDPQVYGSLVSALSDFNLYTKEGIDEIIAYIDSTDTKVDDGLKLSLEKLKETLFSNISLTILSITDEVVNNWSDSSKILSKLTSGLDLSDVNSVIELAKLYDLKDSFGNATTIDFLDFLSNEGKLVLTAEKANAYWDAFFSSLEKKITNVETDLDNAMKQLTGTDDLESLEGIKLNEVTEEINNETAELFKTILGPDFSKYFEAIIDENTLLATGNFKVLENTELPLDQAVIQAYENNRDLVSQYYLYIAWLRAEIETSYARSLGIYKLGDTVLSSAELSKIANGLDLSGNKLSKNAFTERAIKDQINSVYDTLISDVLSKGFENINLADYEGLIANTDINLSGKYEDFVNNYVDFTGKTIDEINDLILEAREKDREKVSEDLIKDVTFISDKLAWIDEETLGKLANAFNIPLQNLLNSGAISWNKTLNQYAVDIEKLKDEGISLESIDNFSLLVQESIEELFENLASKIKSALSGSLDSAGKKDLEDTLETLGIENLNLQFTKTTDGLKLAAKSAKELYFTIRDIDALLGEIVFDELKESLIESDDHFKSMSSTLAYIKELEESIKSPDNSLRIDDLEKELELAQKINAERSTSEDSSYEFMDNKIPAALNNPLNYWSNWTDAFDKIRTSATSTGKAKNTIGYQDFYNIITEMGNLADLTGEGIKWGNQIVDNSETAASLIELAAGALKSVDGEMVVDLSKIKMNVNTSGIQNMAEDVDAALNVVADEQIEMLDSLIALLEIIVAMENLKDIDVDFDGELDLSEIFEDWDVEIGDPKKFTDKMSNAAKEILDYADSLGKDSDLYKALDSVSINGYTVREILDDATDGIKNLDISAELYQAAVNALYQAMLSNDYDLDNIGESLMNILSSAGLDSVAIDVGTKTYYLVGENLYIVDWENKDAIAAAELALKDAGIWDDTKDIKDNILAAINLINDEDYEFNVDLEYAISLATGKVSINKITKGERKGLFEGNYNGLKFYLGDEESVAKVIKQALNLENEGFTVKIDELANIDANYSLGKTNIKYDTKTGKYYVEGDYGGEYKTLRAAIEDQISKGFANETDVGAYDIKGKDFEVAYSAELQAAYSIWHSALNGDTYYYNGLQFSSYDDLIAYVSATNLTQNKKQWNLSGSRKAGKETFTYKKNGEIKVIIDYSSGEPKVTYEAFGKTFTDPLDIAKLTEIQNLVTASENLGGEISLNETTGNIEARFVYDGMLITATINAESGEFTYTFTDTATGTTIEASSLSVLKSAIAGVLGKDTGGSDENSGTIKVNGVKFTYEMDAEGHVVVKFDSKAADETATDEEIEQWRADTEKLLNLKTDTPITSDLPVNITASAINLTLADGATVTMGALDSAGGAMKPKIASLEAEVENLIVTKVNSLINNATMPEAQDWGSIVAEVSATLSTLNITGVDNLVLSIGAMLKTAGKLLTVPMASAIVSLLNILNTTGQFPEGNTLTIENITNAEGLASTLTITKITGDKTVTDLSNIKAGTDISAHADGTAIISADKYEISWETANPETGEITVLTITIPADLKFGDAANLLAYLDANPGTVTITGLIDPALIQNEINKGVYTAKISINPSVDGEGAEFDTSDIVLRLENTVSDLDMDMDEGLDWTNVFNQDLAKEAVISSFGLTTDAAKEAIGDYVDSIFSEYSSQLDSGEFTGTFSEFLTNIQESLKTATTETGSLVGEGFVEGMESQLSNADTGGQVLGDAGIKGLKTGSGVASPSIYGIETGEFIGEGLVQGLETSLPKVEAAAEKLGQAIIDKLEEAVTKISESIDKIIEAIDKIKEIELDELDTKNLEKLSTTLETISKNLLALATSGNWALLNSALTLINTLLTSINEHTDVFETIATSISTFPIDVLNAIKNTLMEMADALAKIDAKKQIQIDIQADGLDTVLSKLLQIAAILEKLTGKDFGLESEGGSEGDGGEGEGNVSTPTAMPSGEQPVTETKGVITSTDTSQVDGLTIINDASANVTTAEDAGAGEDLTLEGSSTTVTEAIDGGAGSSLTLEGGTAEVASVDTPDNAEFIIKTKVDSSAVDSYNPPPKTSTATYNVLLNGDVPGPVGPFDVYYRIHKSGSIPTTQATGNIGLAKAAGTPTLMGELGPELVVQDGHYFVAGLNGAEMVGLGKDAIVFNHLLTEQLLKNGMSSGRGRAVTNERNAVAFATGNINGGPAMASASAALAALKQLRAMWQSLQSATAKDLAGTGGSGGGGGGGSDSGSDSSGRKAFIEDVERWYNLLLEIDKLELKINHEEALRAKLQSDFSKNGKAYYLSQKRSLLALKDQILAQEELNLGKESFFEQRRTLLNEDNGPFSQLYEFDENGQLKYKKDTTIKGSSETNGYAFLADLMAQNTNTGETKYTVEELYLKLKAAGFEKYMKYDSSGNEIVLGGTDSDDGPSEDDYNTYYSSMVQAFWDRVEAQKEEMQTLHDDIEEGKVALLEAQEAENELLEEMRDNLMELEDEVLDAIEDMKLREIDALEDERDKLEESVGKYIDGLNDALDREREMYDTLESLNELDTLKRRLAILQRSGGSAADISSLLSEILANERDLYFNAQEAQINAIQEASDLEIERLDTLIGIMLETLDYLKEFGLLWYLVYDVMNRSSGEITNFIMNGNSDFWKESALGSADKANDILFQADQWDGYRKDVLAAKDSLVTIATASQREIMDKDYAIFDEGMKKTFGDNYDKSGKYKDLYYQEYEEGLKLGDITEVSSTVRSAYTYDADIAKRKKEAGNYWTYTKDTRYIDIDDEYHWEYKYKEETIEGVKGWYFISKKKKKHVWDDATGKCSKCGHKKPAPAAADSGGWSPDNCSDKCSGICKGQLVGGSSSSGGSSSKGKEAPSGSTGKCNGNCSGTCNTVKATVDAAKKGNYKLASGGYVGHGYYELGEQGTETVLTAQQTRVLRNNILSNRPSSLISLLKTYNEGFSRMETPLTGTTTEDNSTNIDKLEFSMNVQQISNDYDARRAGEQAMNEIMRIARKTSAANSIRR